MKKSSKHGETVITTSHRVVGSQGLMYQVLVININGIKLEKRYMSYYSFLQAEEKIHAGGEDV